MKILIVSATEFEIAPILEHMDNIHRAGGPIINCMYKNLEIDILVTGVGMSATAFYCGKWISDSHELALNVGICGSFNSNLVIGTVVNIYEDCFSELGAEDGEAFLTLDDLKLNGFTKIENTSGAINVEIEKLPKVNAITVNTSHGNETSIKKVVDRFHPIVESMEGAAFMFACKSEQIPYVQIRAVSNYVEKRNKENWNIPLAIENLNKKVLEILDNL